MRTTYKALIAGAALAAIGTAANAQFPFDIFSPGYGGPDTATLYEYPNFQGRSVVVTREQSNLDSIGFNDRARSIRVTGSWRLCEDAGFRSRCETVNGTVADLGRFGFHGVSSLQKVADGGYGYPGQYPDGGYGGYPGQGDGPVQGRDVVFYPGVVGSAYGAPYGSGYGSRRTADEFCRSMGHRSSAWSSRSGGELSDVVCRR